MSHTVMNLEDLTPRQLDWIATMIATKECSYIKKWYVEELIIGARAGDPYTSDWLWAGDLVDKYRITLVAMPDGTWQSTGGTRPFFHQKTACIAITRAFVYIKLGLKVSIPDAVVEALTA